MEAKVGSENVDTEQVTEQAFIICKICFSDVPISDMMTLQECQCTYCKECVQNFVTYQIKSSITHIQCPDSQCQKQGMLSVSEIESLVSEDIMMAYLTISFNKEIEGSKKFVWCPSAGCDMLCHRNPELEIQSVICPQCDFNFCSSCKQTWHPNQSCPEDTVSSMDPEIFKKCPVCRVMIEKFEGCSLMQCSRCSNFFCWHCLAPTERCYCTY